MRQTSGTGEVIVFKQTLKTNISGTGHPEQFPDDWEPNLFPEDRAKGPVSHWFESAQKFAKKLHGDT